ncbi:hypothetical protein ACLOJK_013672 [Asimina triloba]
MDGPCEANSSCRPLNSTRVEWPSPSEADRLPIVPLSKLLNPKDPAHRIRNPFLRHLARPEISLVPESARDPSSLAASLPASASILIIPDHRPLLRPKPLSRKISKPFFFSPPESICKPFFFSPQTGTYLLLVLVGDGARVVDVSLAMNDEPEEGDKTEYGRINELDVDAIVSEDTGTNDAKNRGGTFIPDVPSEMKQRSSPENIAYNPEPLVEPRRAVGQRCRRRQSLVRHVARYYVSNFEVL